jgi:ribose-phosphate pyrophosphokinase
VPTKKDYFMITININKQIGCKTLVFPDNQPHLNIFGVKENDEVRVICSLTSTNNLLFLLQCSAALDSLFAKKKILVIPYLMGARFDRLMQAGDSFDLKVISDLINSCGFEKVYLYDVHSEVSNALIKNSVNITNRALVEAYKKKNAVLICPDAGASKKTGKYFEWNTNLKDLVQCIKTRDLSNGNITLKVLEAEKCTDKNCVIVDDLCDGGGTFLAIASQIKPRHLTLIITHAIFSKGTDVFNNIFSEIITSDTYKIHNSELVTTIKFNY